MPSVAMFLSGVPCLHTLQVTNENLSHYLDDNCAQFGCDKTADEEAFEESNLMHSINGRVYANLDGLDMVVDDKVRWLIAAFGTEVSDINL
jgi:hypothetical protein